MPFFKGSASLRCIELHTDPLSSKTRPLVKARHRRQNAPNPAKHRSMCQNAPNPAKHWPMCQNAPNPAKHRPMCQNAPNPLSSGKSSLEPGGSPHGARVHTVQSARGKEGSRSPALLLKTLSSLSLRERECRMRE